MPDCQKCGEPITNKFLTDYCVACIENAMDNLTVDDIAEALHGIEKRIATDAAPLDPAAAAVWDANTDKLYK